MQLPTISTLILSVLALSASTTTAQSDGYYNLDTRSLNDHDLIARSAAAEAYADAFHEAIGLGKRSALADADADADVYDSVFDDGESLFRRHETLQECYSHCSEEAKTHGNANHLISCRRACAAQYGGAGRMGRMGRG
ncbi:hypothetical protein MMC19_001415 [Ptychographa xylographoides]|nr:hypothetical protein [Ptychographa xylographoides]